MDFRNVLLIILCFFGASFMFNYYSVDNQLTKKRMKEIEYSTKDYMVTCALPHFDPKIQYVYDNKIKTDKEKGYYFFQSGKKSNIYVQTPIFFTIIEEIPNDGNATKKN